MPHGQRNGEQGQGQAPVELDPAVFSPAEIVGLNAVKARDEDSVEARESQRLGKGFEFVKWLIEHDRMGEFPKE